MPYSRTRLGYPFNYRTLLEQDSSRDFVAGDPSTPDDCNFYVLQITNDERKRLQSALFAGLDLLYPDEFLDLMQIWYQMTDFPNTFPPATGDCSVDLCQLILECIETTPELQQAIAGYSLGSSITETTPEQTEIAQTDFVQGQPNCDNDKLFGLTTGLTDLLNQISEDLLELLVTAPAVIGRLGDLIEAIPVVETLPLDDALQFAEKLATQVNDAYQAAYDTQIRDDFRCDLFCIGQQTCTLTIEQARDYFQSQLTNNVSNTNFLTIANDIIANNWLGEQSIYLLHWLILDTMIFGGEILGIDHNRLVYQVAALFNDPDSDWSILCDSCCTPVTDSFDFLTSDYATTWRERPTIAPNMQWVNGQGWEGFDPGGVQIVTDRYDSVQAISGVYSSSGNVRARMFDFDEPTDTPTYVADLPFTGNYTLNNSLLIVIDGQTGSGGAVSYLEQLDIDGCTFE